MDSIIAPEQGERSWLLLAVTSKIHSMSTDHSVNVRISAILNCSL
jgi:hypothetical protein